jgi:hypothetical protein
VCLAKVQWKSQYLLDLGSSSGSASASAPHIASQVVALGTEKVTDFVQVNISSGIYTLKTISFQCDNSFANERKHLKMVIWALLDSFALILDQTR